MSREGYFLDTRDLRLSVGCFVLNKHQNYEQAEYCEMLLIDLLKEGHTTLDVFLADLKLQNYLEWNGTMSSCYEFMLSIVCGRKHGFVKSVKDTYHKEAVDNTANSNNDYNKRTSRYIVTLRDIKPFCQRCCSFLSCKAYFGGL